MLRLVDWLTCHCQASIINDPEANYRVYFVNQIMRHLDEEDWEESWLEDQQTKPLWTVAFDGVTYVWVYGEPPERPAAGGPEYEMSYRLGEHIYLNRVRISADVVTSGSTLIVAPIWKSDGEVEKSYKVFCHIMSEDGELVTQRDGFPLNGVRHTPSWRAGEVIEDSYEIQLADDLLPGEYQLSLGMYDPDRMERLPVYDADGKVLNNGRIVVGGLLVEATEGGG